MRSIYRHLEKTFEKIVSTAIGILGNSITFIVALVVVIVWLTNKKFIKEDIHYQIGDVIPGVTFLSLFIIQKSFNRFSGSLNLKINELVVSHENANNKVLNFEEKTEMEITELMKEYTDLAVLANEEAIEIQELKVEAKQ